MFNMRMSRVNITVPDDVAAQARAAGLNVSRVATAALVEELDRRAKTKALDAYLLQLENKLGSLLMNRPTQLHGPIACLPQRTFPSPVILTSDPHDIAALVDNPSRVIVSRV